MISPSSEQSPPVDQAHWFVHEVQSHEPALRSYLRGAFPGVRDVDDVVQESYVRIWQRQVRQPIASGRAFLFTVARRLVFDLLRRQRSSPIETVDNLDGLKVEDDGLAVADCLAQREKLTLLIEAIDALPARCRDVVILRKLHLLSQREVATRLGISEKGVETQLARGLGRCRTYLRERGLCGLFDDESR